MTRWLASSMLLFLAVPLSGSGRKWTQAENMGFAGPIKSVSTTSQTFMRQPIQPDGPTIIYPLSCGECEFDREGNITRRKSGGDLERRILDAQGRVQQETWENEKGEVTARNVYTNGPEGNVQSESYRDGKLFNTASLRYDSQGNLVESTTYKPDGTLDSHELNTFDERGNEIESVSEGPGDLYYDVIQTYNQKTGHLESFTSLNRDGSMRLLLRMNDKTVLSYWQQPGDKPTYGSGICFDDDEGTERDCRDYNWDGTFATTHYTFTDKTKRNPVKAILYNKEHNPLMETDYEYELDAFGNWTRRTVWVWTREAGERKLLEKDARTLTYYPARSLVESPR